MKTLQQLRNEIDTIDDALLKTLEKRRKLVQEVGRYKKEQHIPIIDKKREEEKLAVLLAKGDELGIPSQLISQIWKILYNDAYTLEE